LKISIITVSYNSASVIKDCLNSVKKQKYGDIEHIVIDGASTDGTLSILESKRKQLGALISESDEGIYYAMNKGIKIATGDIIGFLNSDDFYPSENVLSRVAEVFNGNPNIDGCYSDLIYTDKADISINKRYWKSNKFVPNSFSKGWCPPHPTFFVRSSIYKKFGNFDLSYSIASDIELMMRLLEVNKIKVFYIPELWVKMRIGGKTNKNLINILIQNVEVLSALKKHKLSFNYISFFIHKLISRSFQFFKK